MQEWPEELERYRRLYPSDGSGYLRGEPLRRIEGRLTAVRRGAGITDRRRIVLSPPPEPEQLGLAI